MQLSHVIPLQFRIQTVTLSLAKCINSLACILSMLMFLACKLWWVLFSFYCHITPKYLSNKKVTNLFSCSVNELRLVAKDECVSILFLIFRFQRNTLSTICTLSEEVILTRSRQLMKTQTQENDSSHILFMGLDLSLTFASQKNSNWLRSF